MILASCQTKRNNHLIKGDEGLFDQKKYPPFDTAHIISQLNFKDSMIDMGLLLNDKDEKVCSKIDTLELTYIAYACECASWVVAEEFEKNYKNNYPDGENPSDNFKKFNLTEYGYYIEPATEDIALPEYLIWTGNKITFLGRFFKGKRKGGSDEPSWTKKEEYKVFKYYGYKMHRPYEVLGPLIPDFQEDIYGKPDTNWHPMILEIK